MPRSIEIRRTLEETYSDVLTPDALRALEALAHLDADRRGVMASRIARRTARARDRQRITFLDPSAKIARTTLTARQAREGAFTGSEIPADLQRQWIQGTGPAARPGASTETSLRNVAYALLSGADGWMFDGEDALGQVSTMSLDNQRNLKLAVHRDAVFLKVAADVAGEMNRWAKGFFGRETIADWKQQLGFTTKIFRARGLHLDDRHIRHTTGEGFSASIVDAALFVVNNHKALGEPGASLVLYLPKIQTAEEAALWHDILSGLESHLGLPQHGPVGIYQQRVGRDGLGSRVHQPQHRRDHDDVRVHAELRGPRAPRRQHAGSARTVRVVARRHGAEHPGRIGGRRRRRHEARVRRRRARAARGRQRQVGRPLEDGPHRPAGVGEGR
jgi:malate synthase